MAKECIKGDQPKEVSKEAKDSAAKEKANHGIRVQQARGTKATATVAAKSDTKPLNARWDE